MQIIRAGEDVTAVRRALRGTLALVPTMGALHAGHLRLVQEAKRQAERVAATIFVNPLQFGPDEDLGRYPRQEARDLRLLEEAGCDLLWLPGAGDLYPDGFATSVSVTGISERWEGEARPGHFAGVATVVAKLLIAVAPDVALFGEKDFQQLAVIRRMVRDLSLPVEIVGVPTVRDEDGLALSSRNAYLSDEERARSVALPRALAEAAEAIRGGRAVEGALAEGRGRLLEAGFSGIDYFALVDAASLEPLTEVRAEMRLIVAAVIGPTRLIDNFPV
ncbi:MAG: Pantoate--beta-alanine ligase [uncultured Sphingomonas sp.]|uniref:Pantothenate synthetase n=1 Tax=uncultured Sphingomonas sp. TaxID=158754 RepID=A0A6J4TBZ7_9SPHN|nr:pantoate--beta-alanine ligase [uncultured Sphingomonas sp.]CAA9519067.1 MAG: Pantoate--beta-alanine ligase [uncultured Sphingomonas sp.]